MPKAKILKRTKRPTRQRQRVGMGNHCGRQTEADCKQKAQSHSKLSSLDKAEDEFGLFWSVVSRCKAPLFFGQKNHL